MARAMMFGVAISPGISIAPIHFLHCQEHVKFHQITEKEVSSEQKALRSAVASVRKKLEEAISKVPQDLLEYRDIIAAQMEMARDPKLLDATLSRIECKRICASWALEQTIDELCVLFEGIDDPYLRDRTQDIRSVGLRISESLASSQRKWGGDGKGGILVAEDISPADVIEIQTNSILGLLTTQGGMTSHTAILARGQRIPALAGINKLLETAKEGEVAILNGLEGYVLLAPDEQEILEHQHKLERYTHFQHQAMLRTQWPAETKDGVGITIEANLESSRNLENIATFGAEGIGLYRTEFAFLGDILPSEDDLFHEYAQITRALPDKRIVFRTLDAGADKMIRLYNSPQGANPALGLRGIRFCLRHPAIFRRQLRAILRASVYGNVAIMLPLITNADELFATRRLLQELEKDLSSAHIPYSPNIPLGVMIETPSAALIADLLAPYCNFFSIGTNDLVHYCMAIDRNNRQVSYLHNPLHPAVLRAIRAVIDAGHREGINVSVCGELATDPAALALLLGMGVDGLSVAPSFIPTLKQNISRLSLSGCMALVNDVLLSADSKTTSIMVYEYIHRHLGSDNFFQSTNSLVR